MIERPPRRVPFNITHTWESQASQYDRPDIPRVRGISYWQVPQDLVPVPIHCLLHHTGQMELIGILNYFPEGSAIGERPHDTTTLVKPVYQRLGIGTGLLLAAIKKWPEIDLLTQCYTDAGWALASSILNARQEKPCH